MTDNLVLTYKQELDRLRPVFKGVRKLIDTYAHWYIIPYEIQGCINVTEFGIKPEALNVNDYSYFEKVVSGYQPIVATWEKSTRYFGENKRYPHMQNELGAKVLRGVGDQFKGSIMSDVASLEFNSK